MRGLKVDLALAVATTLLLVAAGALFVPAVAQQATPAGNGQPASLDGTSPAQPKGYADSIIAQMTARLAQSPSDYTAMSQIAAGYLQKARETNDPTFYTQARQALDHALAIKPDDYDSIAEYGSLELSLHQFSSARQWGEQAKAINPYKSFSFGVIGDAEVELGKYEEAVSTFQQMVDLRPDLASYSRVSYMRELYGDVPGAIQAMQQAISAGGYSEENTAWCRVQLGNLYFNSNQLDKAEQEYQQALVAYPNYLHAQAGLAQVRAAQGRTSEAIALYQEAVKSVPLPQYLIALADLYASTGDQASAKKQYDLVLFIYKVFEANGVNADIEKASFLAHVNQNPEQAVALAEKATKERQDVNSLDTLAWSLCRDGRYADALAAEKSALRLGTQNAMFYYHLGMIQLKSGDTSWARKSLERAMQINPHFDPLSVLEIKSTLKSLSK